MASQVIMSKLRRLDNETQPDTIGYRKIVQSLNRAPDVIKRLSYNHMTPYELYSNILLDNPKINFCESFLEYLNYLRSIIDEVSDHPNGEKIINIFGLLPKNNWKSLSQRDHLLDIAVADNLFWEFISWDCPFVITLLVSIQNNDSTSLMNYIDFYECLDAESGVAIFEYLVKYAFDFRRIGMIEDIINKFMPLLKKDDVKHMINDKLAILMDYFTENYRNFNPRIIVDMDADFSKLVEILEKCFPDIYSYIQINWSGYLYYLVRRDDSDSIMELAGKLKPPYMYLDYEIVIYAMSRNMDALVTILLSGFDWNDTRDKKDKDRFSDMTKGELEKVVYYLLQNIENSNSTIESGFNPSSVCYNGRMTKTTYNGINYIYTMHDKRFHTNVYLKSVDARKAIMEKWCQKANIDPHEQVHSVFNDLEQNIEFRKEIEKILVNKLNRTLKSIDKYHNETEDIPDLICQFITNSQLLYQYEQYERPDVKVI